MLYPEINKLRDAAGSRYFLVTMASKRARDLIDGCPKLDPTISTNKPVSIAAEEIAQDLFTYKPVVSVDSDDEEFAEEGNEGFISEPEETDEIEAEPEAEAEDEAVITENSDY